MRKTIIPLIMCYFVIPISAPFFFGQAYAADKVVVIPLNSARPPTCVIRESAYENLDTWYKAINVSCLEGEMVMSGGFDNGNYSTTRNCRVIESRPVGNEWHVTWGMPTETECAAYSAKTFALCCTW